MNSPRPLVSVVIPAYNAERTVRATLDSVLRQTFTHVEVILVDDGSTDRTSDVARSLGDPRLRIIKQANAGHAQARNIGIGAATGTYVAVVDADDVWLPDKLEQQLAVLRGGQVKALHGAAIHVDDSLRPLFIGNCPDGKNELLDILCFRGLPGFMCTLIIERELLWEIGGFDPTLIILQDWELAIRLARREQLYSMSKPLVMYRLHESNQSKKIDLHIEPGERILAEFFADRTLPTEIMSRRRYVYAHFYAMLCGGAVQLRMPRYAIDWAIRAISSDPRVLPHLASLPVRRVRKRASRREARALLRMTGYA
jgi:glycosyltransferase involved in cell wall biosynthesis